MDAKNISGRVFGKLKVISRTGNDTQGYATWLCKCECGNFKEVRGSNLIAGKVKTCGCGRILNDFPKDARKPRYHEDRDYETIIDRKFPKDLKMRMERIAVARGASMQETIRYALITFIERTERQEWFKESTSAIMEEE
jgi:hypothetical protein